MNRQRLTFSLGAIILLGGSLSIADAATIVIVNTDPPGVGFNDATAAAPVGGNAGTTLGQQRLNVFNDAAAIWGARLSSPITIRIDASFGPLTPCTPVSGVVGSAGPTNFLVNFAGAPRSNTWYPVALASALAGSDLAGGGASIQAQFNSNIGTAGCLTGLSWYLGLDGNHGSQLDLETVLLHEFAHGLGFLGLVNLSDGSMPFNLPDIFAHTTFDSSIANHWDVMSNAQRLASITNTGNVVFDGSNVVAGAATILSAGKDGSNRPNLFVPNPVVQGSSVYHFDTSASPNQIMEPAVSSDLTHNVDAPFDLTAKTLYDIGWPPGATYNPPTGVEAHVTGATTALVSWVAPAGGTAPGRYNVYRSQDGTTYSFVGFTTPPTVTLTDTVSTNKAYLYRVRTADAGNSTESPDSNRDLATIVVYTNPTITAGTSTIQAVDMNELRTAVNAVRTLNALGAASYTFGTVTAGLSVVHALDVTELRTNLNTPLGNLGLTLPVYTNATITAGSSIVRAVDFNELRNAMR